MRSRLLLVSILLTLLPGAVQLAGQPAIAPTGTLRVAFIAGNPAMAVKNPATGELSGPAVDLARELARQRRVEVELLGVQTPQNVIDAVRTGQADVGFVAYNPERAGAVEFSRPFMLVQQSFLVKQDSPIRSVREIDQPNLKIGARKADSMALYLARTLKRAKLVEITESNGGEGTLALAAGEVDAFGSNRQRLNDTMRGAPGLRLLPDDLYDVEQTIIVPAGNAERLNTVNAFIDEVRRSGFLAQSIVRSGVVGIAVAGP
ncbi:MAG: transporter substrate-binding domain-containing protein [Vicinamibacterales bacterium]|nr:transporter substrate-binding domain-containing protein [Vicinamibacterales bacterium]